MSDIGEAIEKARVTGLKALVYYGPSAQMDKMHEECGELTTALARCKHGRATHAEVLEELVDVVIVAMQLMSVFGNGSKVHEVIEAKRQRLEGRLKVEQ